MTIERRTILYDNAAGGPFEGTASTNPEWITAKPGIMIIPNVLGPKELDYGVADRLARMGYAAFVADVYGQGNRATRADEDPARFMNALNDDRAALRDRVLASLDTMKAMSEVEGERTAAIGYCFGGKSVLDLARAGGDVRGVVSFHGLFDPPSLESAKITAKILVCHGWDDPLAEPQDVLTLATELTAAKSDWQIHAYGHVGHGFTDTTAPSYAGGFGYRDFADRRSWAAMENFLAEVLG